MEFKGTKGKWEVENVFTPNGDYYKVKADTSVCNITSRNQELAEANAHIIAAAPDLLELVCKIRKVLMEAWPKEEWIEFDKEVEYTEVIEKVFGL